MTVVLPGGLGQLMAPHVYSAWATASSTGAPPGWNSSASIPTFSNNNRSVISAGTSIVSGASYKTAGKLYFEITCAAAFTDATSTYCGIGSKAYSLTGGVGSDANSVSLSTAQGATVPWAMEYNAAFSFQFTNVPVNGDVVGVAVDLSIATQISTYFRLNANWLNRGTPQTTFPTTADQIISITSGTGAIIAVVVGSSGTMTLNTGNAAFANAAPAGYAAWG